MNRDAIEVGFIPLVDCAPLVVAREIGFAEEEGLDLHLRKAPSWSSLRDRLALGALDAAHMLAPMPVAMSLGLGGIPAPLDALAMISAVDDGVGRIMDRLQRHGIELFAHEDPDVIHIQDCTRSGAAIDHEIRVDVQMERSIRLVCVDLDGCIGPFGGPVPERQQPQARDTDASLTHFGQ